MQAAPTFEVRVGGANIERGGAVVNGGGGFAIVGEALRERPVGVPCH
ncbi:MAG TPA: hypothetical protein VFH60_04955 [Chloroflexia bacterium]|nr:hypothetical protein [Chloroflexia bacterium]